MRGESGGREPLRDRSSPAPPRTAGTGGREPEAPLERARRPTGTFATRAVLDSAARVAFFWFLSQRRDVTIQTGGLCAGFGYSGVPNGACSPARQASMPDSPPQAIHGLLSEQKSTRLNFS